MYEVLFEGSCSSGDSRVFSHNQSHCAIDRSQYSSLFVDICSVPKSLFRNDDGCVLWVSLGFFAH